MSPQFTTKEQSHDNTKPISPLRLRSKLWGQVDQFWVQINK